jgi:hypothetical protein
VPAQLAWCRSLWEDVVVNERPPVPDRSDPEDSRRRALIAFLSAGMAGTPATAQLVSALAAARRAVAANRSHSRLVDDWLRNEIHFRGIRENAAVLAALEIPEMRENVALEYRVKHPDREDVLNKMLTNL